MRGPKFNKTRKLNTLRKAELMRSYKKDLQIARHRGFPNTSVMSLKTRKQRNLTRRANINKSKEEASKRAKMAQSVVKLRYLNKQLKTALDAYNDKTEEGNVSGELIDAVSILIDSIKGRIENMRASLPGFKSDNIDHPYEFLDDFSDYIDDDIIHGFKKASHMNVERRVKESNVILKILHDSIMENARDLNAAIEADMKNQNEINNNNDDNNDLADALENMMGLMDINA